MTDYAEFLQTKQLTAPAVGIDVRDTAIHPSLFPFQRELVKWSLRKGRAALFCDTGLGKTRMQLEWARLTGLRTLILAPLAVAQQTIHEAATIGIDIVYAKTQAESDAGPAITITNYERLDKFDPLKFDAVVLDESSILKGIDSKTRARLIEAFAETPYRLCCTATPAPNDIAEMANHAEFLGVLTRVEMLATFFVHDDQGWRLKGHAKDAFYRWLASWGMSVKRPSDLGYDDAGYALPPLTIEPVILPVDYAPPDQLFFTTLRGITDRAAVRRETLAARVAAAADLVNADPAEPWLVWVGLNDEGREIKKLISDAVLIEGKDDPDKKADALTGFANGDIRVLITKPSIAGFGMNFQRCAQMVFVGLSDSYEQYYQAIRRCWRFGQKRPVTAHVVLTEPEEAIYHNVLRKESDAIEMSDALVAQVAAYEQRELAGHVDRLIYAPSVQMIVPAWVGA